MRLFLLPKGFLCAHRKFMMQDVPILGVGDFLMGLHQICRPSGPYRLQESFYNGRKKHHGIQFQLITMADGMVLVSKGFPGVTHDARVYDESKTEEKMETINYPADDGTNNEYYHVFGDKGYAVRGKRLLSSIIGNNLHEVEKKYNLEMSALRVSVENIMAKQRNLFRLIDYSKTQKLRQCPVIEQYYVSMFLMNCHSCIYGNQVASFFGITPPPLQLYLSGLNSN